jgi:photosystem II stability/assembly factor-like uncharacterized protein
MNSTRPSLLPVCLSTNGTTLSITQQPARSLLVATVDGVVEFARDSVSDAWQQTRHTLRGSHISSLLYEPESRLLFAGCHYSGGIKVSDDGGQSWTDRSTGLSSGHVYSLQVQTVSGKTVLYAGTEPPMICRSDDLGLYWSALPGIWEVPDTDQWRFPPPPHFAHLKNVAFHPDFPQVLYACVEQGDLLKSSDGGNQWRSITSYEAPWHQFRRDMHRVIVVPSDPSKLFLATGVGLFYSINAGASWEHLTTSDFPIGYPDPLFLDPQDEQTLYMAGASKAPNPSWSTLGSAHPAVARSQDGGRSWKLLHQGLPDPVPGNIEAMALQYSSASGVTLYIGTAVGELWFSDNAGDSWQPLASHIPPVSKGAHYRRFLSDFERDRIEQDLRALATSPLGK